MRDGTVLIFIARYLCYASNASFALQLGEGLRALGYQVEVCSLLEDDDAGLTLMRYVGRSYTAVIDFNSTLPRAMVGQERFLDLIDAPFYDYIVDHPLYHHPILQIPLQNFHVICVDASHADYARHSYPHLKGAHFLPLTGLHALTQISFARKKRGILFAGTYYPPEKYAAMMDESRERELMWEMAQILLVANARRECYAPEEAFADVVTQHGAKEMPEDAPALLNRCYPAEIYVRAVQRRERVLAMARAGLPLTVCGNDWDQAGEELQSMDNVTLIDGIDYSACLEVIASAQVVYNILPGFTQGTHDRMFLAMANASVALTDTNAYIEAQYADGEDCLYYRSGEEARLHETLQLQELLSGIAQRGRERYEAEHTWGARARELAQILEGAH